MLRHYFGPNPAGLFCLLLLFVVQWPLQTEVSTYTGATPTRAGLTHRETNYGLPPTVVITSDYYNGTAKRTVHVDWLNLCIALMVGYLAAMPLGRILCGQVFPNQMQAGAPRPVRTLLLCIACAAAISIVATFIWHRFFPHALGDDPESFGPVPWLTVWTGFTFICAIPTLFIAIIVLCVKRIREARHARTTGFAVLPTAPPT